MCNQLQVLMNASRESRSVQKCVRVYMFEQALHHEVCMKMKAPKAHK